MVSLTESNRKWWVLASMMSSLAMIFVDQTALPVALPSIQQNFNAGAVALQWIVNAYLLALAIFVILGGKLGDTYGHRKIFLIGLIIFILSSASCALAPSALSIIISRWFQGIGGALMIPSSMTVMINAFPPNQRGLASGIYVGGSAVFATLGPLVGGALTQYLSWRFVFWVNFPIAIAGLTICLLTVPKLSVFNKLKLDWLGFITSSLAIFFIVFTLMQGPAAGWNSPWIICTAIIGILLIFITIHVEKKQEFAFIPPHLFSNANYRNAIILLLFIQISFISSVFLAIFLQTVLALSPAEGGLAMLPLSMPVIFMAPVAGKIRDRFGPRLPIIIGITLCLLSILWLSIFSWLDNYWWLLPALITFGGGAPMVMSSTITTALVSAGSEERGIAAGISTASRQLGAALGIAMIGSIINTITHVNFNHLLQQPLLANSSITLQDLYGLLASTKQAQLAISQLTSSGAAQVFHEVIRIHTLAFSSAMFAVSIILLISLLVARKMPKYI